MKKSCPESVANERIYETLKKIQTGMADQRSAVADLRADLREVKASNAMILAMISA